MRTDTLIAIGVGTLVIGLAAGAPAEARLSANGTSLNGTSLNGIFQNGLAAPAQAELVALRVLSVTLPPTKAR